MPTSAVPLQSGRFGAPTISDAEVNRIRGSFSRSDAATVMDHIKDWFCNTKRAEAKECLYDIMHVQKGHNEKIQSFLRLRELCSKPFRDNFKMRISDDGALCFGIAKNHQDFFTWQVIKNGVDQFKALDFYNRSHGREREGCDFDKQPDAMHALLKTNDSYPSERITRQSDFVACKQISNELCRTTYLVSNVNKFAPDECYGENVRHFNVDVWHDSADSLFVGNIQELD